MTLAGLQAAPVADMRSLERLAVAEAAEEAGCIIVQLVLNASCNLAS